MLSYNHNPVDSWETVYFFDYSLLLYTTISSVTQTNMYVIYTSPIQRTHDFDEACIIADDYFNATGYIVAVEKEDK